MHKSRPNAFDAAYAARPGGDLKTAHRPDFQERKLARAVETETFVDCERGHEEFEVSADIDAQQASARLNCGIDERTRIVRSRSRNERREAVKPEGLVGRPQSRVKLLDKLHKSRRVIEGIQIERDCPHAPKVEDFRIVFAIDGNDRGILGSL
jgi:hypothetical protein